jgi:hypothetical protein
MIDKDDDRARRLAAALRENLKRRKAQAREKFSDSSRRKPCPEPGEGAGPMNTEDEN